MPIISAKGHPMEPRFIHLRIHTEYSLIDGLVQIKPLIDKAVECRMPAVAITDQSNLFATVKFYQAAIGAGVKPLIGADVWLANEKQIKQPYRITLFCQNETGYKNLLTLISKSYTENQSLGKAVIKREWLQERAQGLIILSGAEDGDLGQALLADDQKQIKECLAFWSQCFPNRYYLELRRTGIAQQENYIQAALHFAEKNALPVVATNDVRFIYRDDFDAHEARVCIHEGFILADPKRPKNYTEQQYFRSQEEMCALFSDIPEALENTIEIAKRCNVSFTLGKTFTAFSCTRRFYCRKLSL